MHDLKKIIFSLVLASFLPTAVLADDVELQLLVSPLAAPSAGEVGGSGSSGVGGNPSTALETRQTNTVSGWTSPSAFVETIIDGKVVGTSTSATNGSFIVNASVGVAKYLTVNSTDVFGALARLSDPIGLGSATGTITGVLLPPSLSLPSAVFPTGSPVVGSGRTVPGGALSAVLSGANGKTLTLFPVVGASGDYRVSFDARSLLDGNYVLQISLNFSGKTAVTSANITIGKAPLVLPTRPPVNVPILPGNCYGYADLNCDGKVDLRDVSILLAYYNKSSAPPKIDLNNDGKVNLIDFSIMLYYLNRPLHGTLSAAMVDAATEDRTPPVVTLDIGQGMDGDWLAAWSAVDQETAVKEVEISTDNGKSWRQAESPYSLGSSKPASVIVKAIDDSGNMGLTRYGSKPIYQTVIAVAIGALVALGLIYLLNLIFRHRVRS